MKKKWAIIGGGLLGMTLALRLSQQGQAVTIHEQADHLGGLADSCRIGSITWDRYYHVILKSDTFLRHLLTELAIEDQIQWVETKTGFYTDGQLFSMSNSFEFLRFPPLNLFDKLRLGGTIFYASKLKNYQRLEKISAVDWLKKLSGKNTFKKIWLPLLRAKLGQNYEQASAAFIWAIIARMFSARKSGLKKEMFGYLPGGYAAIISAFEKKLTDSGVALCLSSSINSVQMENSSQTITLTAEDEKRNYDRVILTTPNPVVNKICPQLSMAEKAKLQKTVYQGIICVSLLLKSPLSQYYITNITEDWVPFTAVIEMSALVSKKHLDGNHLVYLPKYITTDDHEIQRNDDEIITEFTNALDKMYPHFSKDAVLAARVSKTRYVLPLSTLEYSKIIPTVRTSIPSIYIANSSQIPNGTLNVNETVALANRTLKEFS